MQTRSDVIDIAAGRFQPSIAEEVGNFRAELRSEFQQLRAELAAVERRIKGWMFILWVGQILAQLGILLAFFRT